MKILGIDPGSTLIGFALIEDLNGDLRPLNHGLLEIKAKGSQKKLLEISTEMEKLIQETKPDIAGVEKLFFSVNKKTAIEVSQARGVIILKLVEKGLKVFEISPTEVKSCVAGYGSADKEAVAKMANQILAIQNPVKEDNTADALAIAITTSVKAKQESVGI